MTLGCWGFSGCLRTHSGRLQGIKGYRANYSPVGGGTVPEGAKAQEAVCPFPHTHQLLPIAIRNELDRNMIMLPERDLVYSPGWFQMWDPKCLDYRHVLPCLAFRQKYWVENKSFRWLKQWQQWVTLIWNNILGTIFSQLPNKWHHSYPPPSTENCLFAHELLKDKLPNNPFFSLEILDDVMAVEFIAKIFLPSKSTQHLLPGQGPQVPLPTTCPRAKGTMGQAG